MWTVSEWRYVLLAAVVTVFAAMPVAIAEADGPGANVSAEVKKANVKLKKANERIRALNKRMRAVEEGMGQRLAALEAGAGGSAKPSGAAGGDLFGAYPDPQIAPNAVGFAEIAADAVGADEIADDAVTAAEIFDGTIDSSDLATGSVTSTEILDGSVRVADLGLGSVRARELGAVKAVASVPITPIPGGGVALARVTCPDEARLLSGGFEWQDPFSTGGFVISSSPFFGGNPARTWEVRAIIPNGAPGNRILAEALCLEL